MLAPVWFALGPPRYRLTRAAPEETGVAGSLNSAFCRPILDSTHSIASTRPVVTAMRGMLTEVPSLIERGKRVGLSGSALGSAVVVHAADIGSVYFVARRKRPAFTTSKNSEPTGTYSSSVK